MGIGRDERDGMEQDGIGWNKMKSHPPSHSGKDGTNPRFWQGYFHP